MQKPKLGYMPGNVATQIQHEVWSLESKLLHIKWVVVSATTSYMKFWFIFWH
jgi:hypothetical protein